MLCTCDAAPELLAPWREAMETYGLDGGGLGPNADPRWPHNTLATDALVRACGRPYSASTNAPALAHAPGDAARCAAAAAAMAAALAGLCVRRGDEGDHAWFAFSAPGLLAGAPPPPLDALVQQEELRAACGGALSPHIAYRSTALAAEAAAAAGEAEPQAGEAAALAALAAAPQPQGVGEAVTLLRPLEPRGSGGIPPSVYTFFLLRRTSAGGLCGVAGHAVWT